MSKEIVNTMASKIALDIDDSSLFELQKELRRTNAEWKNSMDVARLAGDSHKVASDKVAKEKDTLKLLGAELEKAQKEQKTVTGTTKDDITARKEWDAKIREINIQVAKHTNSLEKAEKTEKLYKSGILESKKALENSKAVHDSQVKRLEAEGKSLEATKAKYNGLKETLEKQGSLYKKEATYLEELKNSRNKDNSAIAKQKVRINELAASMAKGKVEANELSVAIKKSNQGTFSKLKDSLAGATKEAKKTSKTGEMIKGVFGGQLLASGVTALGSKLKESAKEGFELAESGEQTKRVWHEMGLNDKQVTGMSTQMADLRKQTGFAGGTIIDMQKSFYGLTGSYDKAQKLTKGISALGVSLHLTGEQTQGLTKQFTKVESSGKLSSMTLGRMEKSAHGMTAKLAEAKGVSQDTFKQMVSDGKISSNQFKDLVAKLGDSDKAFKDFGKTGEGASAQMKGTWTSLKATLMAPLVDVKNSGMQSLKEVLQSPEMQKMTEQLGKSIANIAKGLANVMGYIAEHRKDLNSLLSSVGEIAGIMGKTVWNVFSETIKAISDMFGGLNKNSKESKDGLKSFADNISEVAKHKKAISVITKTLLGLFATKKIINFGSSLTDIGKKMIFKPKIDSKTGKKQLTLFAKAVKGTGSIIKKSLAWTVKVATKGAKKVLGAFKKFAGGIKKAVGKALKFTAKVATKGAKLALKGLGATAKITGNALKTAFNFAKSNPLILIASTIAIVIAALIELYKHNKKFKKFVDGLIKAAKDFFKGISKWFGKVGKFVGKIFGGMGKTFSKGYKSMSKLTSKFTKGFSKTWNNAKKNTNKIVGSMFKAAKKQSKDGFNVIQKEQKLFSDIFHGKWKNIGKDAKGIVDGMTKYWKDMFKNVFDFVNKLTGGRLGDMVNTFKKKFGSLGEIISGAIGSVKHAMIGIARNVIKPVNSMLDGLKKGLNWVLGKVGAGKIKADWSISLPKYARGTKGVHPGGLAMVNDAPGGKFREMFRLSSGEIGMFPNKRNMIVPLPKGAEVLDAENSFSFAKAMGMPAYKNGVGDFFGGIWDSAKDIVGDAANIIAHPIKFLEGTFNHFFKGIKTGNEFAGDMLTSLPKFMANQAKNWVKKLFEDVGSTAPFGKGAKRWESTVKKALGMVGLPQTDAYIKAWLSQISSESGGNEKVTQHGYTDINTKTGNLAQGLLQVIPPTFNAYKMKGHNNIFNGLDNMLAAMRYATARYDKGGMLKVIGHGHGYENGGLVNQHQIAEIAEKNKPEMIIPLSKDKRPRGLSLLKETANTLGVRLENDSANNSSDLSNLEEKLETLTVMFERLLNLNASQLNAIKLNNPDKRRQYQIQGKDQIIANYQGL